MKKGFWFTTALLLVCHLTYAAKQTMQYSSQPSGTVYTLPITFNVHNLAPIPQDLCSPTVSIGSQATTCSGLPICRGEAAKKATFSCSVTTSCDKTVPSNQAGGNCSIYLNVTKPNNLPSTTQFSLSLSYGSYNAVLTSNGFILNGTNPTPPASSYRTITFKNSCNYNIWFGTITGAAPSHTILTGGAIDCMGGDPGKQACVSAGGACYARIGAPDACFSQACNSDSDCMTGAACYAEKGKCFWSNPPATNQTMGFQLGTNDSNTVKIPEYESNGIGVVWSGALGGRTGCTTGTCTSALCTANGENAQGICSLGVGFQQPATQAEPTFITYATGVTPSLLPDAYDVTVINGANVPMSMYPTHEPLPTAGNNPYTCGRAGYNLSIPLSQPSGDTIGESSWQMATNQSNLAYRYVIPNSSSPTRCSIDTDCVSGQYCGLSYVSQSIGSTAAPGLGYLVCGTFAGWFTADQICGTNSSFTTALNSSGTTVENFQCDTPIALGTMSNLYQCNDNYAVSCYSSSSSNCCGCVNWSTQGSTTILVPSNTSYVQNCSGQNTTWTGAFSALNQPQVYDTILYLKESCPSCYTYPFDDKSSSFTCTNGSTTIDNTEDYTVEFCPGGHGNTGFQPPAH